MSETPSLPRVLIVDDSRIVRATIIKHLRGSYDFQEAADGEAGWEALLADETIQIVLSDLTMPRLDGYGFLERIRSSEVPRIAKLPFVLISGDEDEQSRARAKSLGASDFITKGIGTTELLARLDSLVKLSKTQGALEESREQQVRHPESGLFTRQYIETQAAQALSSMSRHGVPVTAMLVLVDDVAGLSGKLGAATFQQLMRRFGQMLAGKIRKGDSLGQFGEAQFAIISPATGESGAQIFAARLREAIEQANIGYQGQRIPLTVSVGMATTGPDSIADERAFFELALSRAQKAMAAGGNRIIGSDNQTQSSPRLPTLDGALSLLRAGRQAEIRDHAGELALMVLPLLRLADQELKLDLPLAEIEAKLKARAQEEQDARS